MIATPCHRRRRQYPHPLRGKTMDIRNEENASGGRYAAGVEGHEAEMTYSRTSPKLVIIDHTAVPDALRGKGVGQALALHAVEAARTGGWKIIPLCPFFKAQAQHHPEWRDVVN
ncbi:putative acetyltransferase protein [Rhizobium etli CIAT 652]|nr:putative acetyltransferase protein [Rhizobium etli CIAT 652]